MMTTPTAARTPDTAAAPVPAAPPATTPGATAPALPADRADGPRRTRLQKVGLLLGPAGALAVWALAPAGGLTGAALATAAVVVLVAVWWMTEALPLSATALVPIVALPLTGVLEIREATSAYGDPTVFLFLGGFGIALAMQRWNLHTRIALVVISAVGTRPTRIVLGVMVATAFLSMWVSNTATTLMMIPIGVSLLGLLHSGGDGEGAAAAHDVEVRRFGTGLVLAIAYAATIGGLATLIGSPPNLVLAGLAEQSLGIDISFAGWMVLGVPLATVFLVIAWLLLTRVLFRTRIGAVAGGRELVRERLRDLGRMSRGEVTVAAVFACTALLWVFRQPLADSALGAAVPAVGHLSDAGIAIAALVALFLVPVGRGGGEAGGALDWPTVQRGVPWGVLLLFGGGLCLAAAVQSSGLDAWVGEQFGGLAVLPTVLLVAAVSLGILLITELTSNTATAATFLPVLAGVAVGIGIDPLLLLVPAALAATCSFMLPVGTPPNAIVFGTGRVTMGEMVRAGFWLNLVGVLLITVAVYLLGPLALGIGM